MTDIQKLILTAQQQRDQAKIQYRSLEISLSLLTSLHCVSDKKTAKCMICIPLGQHKLDLRNDYQKKLDGTISTENIILTYQNRIIKVSVEPDPFTVAQQMQIPVMLEQTQVGMCLYGFASADGFLRTYKIAHRNGRLQVYDPSTEQMKNTNVYMADYILDLLAQQIGPQLTRQDLDYKNDNDCLIGFFNFFWPAYQIIA